MIGKRPGRMLGAVMAAAMAVCLAPTASGQYVRGEAERLSRQHYDYHYRNSNRNVFRRSRHFHPTKNVFRSSRYYQQRLAASYDGYPLRTFVHIDGFAGRDGVRSRGIDYSYAYPRRAPYGPPPDLVYYPFGFHDGGRTDAPSTTNVYVDARAAVDAREPRPKLLTREDIEMVPVRVVERKPTHRAVLRTVAAPDGTLRTIIASEPIEPEPEPEQTAADDDGWAMLAAHEYRRAAERFARARLTSDDARATLGYGIALAMQGDTSAALIALERAMPNDASAPLEIDADDTLRAAIEILRDRYAAADDEAGTRVREIAAVLIGSSGSS